MASQLTKGREKILLPAWRSTSNQFADICILTHSCTRCLNKVVLERKSGYFPRVLHQLAHTKKNPQEIWRLNLEIGDWMFFFYLYRPDALRLQKKNKTTTSSVYEEVSVFSPRVKSFRVWMREEMIRRRLEGKVLHAYLSHVAQWCHDAHPNAVANPLRPLENQKINKFPMHGRQRAMSICAETMKQRVIFFFFEALLKAITIGVESTHDNWFAGSKWETTTNSVGGGAG